MAKGRACQYSDIAVLVRTAFQTREMEEKFISEAIPYQVIGGPKFYERAEIRDMLAYLRVIVQPNDDLAFERIINKPARGIGAKSVDKIIQTAKDFKCSMFDAVQLMIEQNLFSGKAKNNLSDLMQKFAVWQHNMQALETDELAEQVLDESGYLDMLKNDTSAEAPGRIENLKELVGVMGDTDTYPTLSEFLEHVSLVMDNDSAIDNNKVMLITLHSAKGLEFKVVFLPGWEEGLFPHQKSLDEGGSNALEEERRLAYVALTRAKQKLYITTTFNRRIYGQWQNNTPSRFLNELPSPCLQIINQTSNCYNGGGSSYYIEKKKSYSETSYTREHEYSYEADDYTDYSSYKSSRTSSLIGVRVYHESFGYGKIVNVSGQTCEVNFDKVGRRKVLGTYLRRA